MQNYGITVDQCIAFSTNFYKCFYEKDDRGNYAHQLPECLANNYCTYFTLEDETKEQCYDYYYKWIYDYYYGWYGNYYDYFEFDGSYED